MKKGTITILSIVVFVTSMIIGIGLLKLNNRYDFDDYLAKICGGEEREIKCVYAHAEYNPFTCKHTFYYQVTNERDEDNKDIIQRGQKDSIEDIFKVANNNGADRWIELGQDSAIVNNKKDYKKLNKGEKITKDDLITIAKDLDK